MDILFDNLEQIRKMESAFPSASVSITCMCVCAIELLQLVAPA